MNDKADRLVKARAALAAARANGTVKKNPRKKREPKEPPRLALAIDDLGALTVQQGKNAWPFTAEETTRLRAFLVNNPGGELMRITTPLYSAMREGV
jgi:hypothetical protein